jgi:predicted NAD/FAD-dependent oxidoreductase
MNPSSSNHKTDILVVGAGIAGLMAAQYLQTLGYKVTAVDREERVGGRMVTEHLGGGWADSGAQFFTARDAQFQSFLAVWQAEGLIFEWSSGWSDGTLVDSANVDSANDGHPRYAAYGGLTAVPRRLAQDLTIHKAVTIQSVTVEGGGWTAVAESGAVYQSHALILTPPVPQSLALLDTGHTTLTAADRAALETITYAPCITAVVWVEGTVNLPEPGALQRPDHPISWIADNRRKGISPQATLITMHVSPPYSRLWWLSPDAELEGAMRRELRPFLAPDGTIHEMHLHRWPYALPTNIYPEPTLLAANLPPLAFAGDAFNGPRVEGAALSGLAAAEQVTRHIKLA